VFNKAIPGKEIWIFWFFRKKVGSIINDETPGFPLEFTLMKMGAVMTKKQALKRVIPVKTGIQYLFST